MFKTKFGPFDGDSWEDLLQLVLKQKYGQEGYQEMPASPGDFGLEGFTLKSGLGFQCYCPDEDYNNDTLFKKQKKKIEDDILKLKKNEKEIASRIQVPLKEWRFISPKINRHKLLTVARTEEKIAISWGLNILTPEFTIILEDGDYYAKEIVSALDINGEPFEIPELSIPIPEVKNGPQEEYEFNLLRKTVARLNEKIEGGAASEQRVGKLYSISHRHFLEHDSFIKAINTTAPQIYFKISKIIAQFEDEIAQESLVWKGEAEDLFRQTKNSLIKRISSELGSRVNETMVARIAQHTLARWLAVCELDFNE